MQKMTNNPRLKNINGLFRKTLVIALFLSAMALTSYAQSGTLYEVRSNYRFGTITAYQSVWRIDLGNGGEIKIYSCWRISATGLGCVFTQFKNGRVTYSGQAQVYQSGAVNLRWMYEFNGNQQRQINGGWNYYQVR